LLTWRLSAPLLPRSNLSVTPPRVKAAPVKPDCWFRLNVPMPPSVMSKTAPALRFRVAPADPFPLLPAVTVRCQAWGQSSALATLIAVLPKLPEAESWSVPELIVVVPV